MTDKIDFLDLTKNEDEILPAEKEKIIGMLYNIPSDIAIEYSIAVSKYAGDLLALTNITWHAGQSIVCRHLIDQLERTQLNRLWSLAEDMSCDDVMSKIDNIIKNTRNVYNPDKECVDKANELMELIKNCNIDHRKRAQEAGRLATLYRAMQDLFTVSSLDKKMQDFVIGKLSHLSLQDLDYLIDISNKNFKSL